MPEKQDTKGKVRVDGFGMKRETLFGSSSSPGSWLSESDVDFFTGGAIPISMSCVISHRYRLLVW